MEDAFDAGPGHGDVPVADAKVRAAWLYYVEGLTQEQIADATSLTPVHVNRTLKLLETRGLITRDKRSVTIPDWRQLVAAGDFNPAYLHLECASVQI